MQGSGSYYLKKRKKVSNDFFKVKDLFERYLSNDCTADEVEEFFRIIQSGDFEDGIIDLISTKLNDDINLNAAGLNKLQATVDDVFIGIKSKIDPLPQILPKRQSDRKWWLMAASIIVCFSVGLYFMYSNRQPLPQVTQTKSNKHDFLPGSNKAILTLAGGKQILLAGASNGRLAKQGHVSINKTADGKIIYNATGEKQNEVLYNTVSTPRGGQYHLTLTDGTEVWLNAASSITYPVTFNGKIRDVQISGEVYFEVTHNAQKPFKVTSGMQTVEVLGTHFNINSYPDELQQKTTLLEGAVKVVTSSDAVTLSPGGQSIIDNASKEHKIKVVENANTEEAVAWKNGKFAFNYTDIGSVMRQISRWYDVEIEYEGKVPDKKLSGSFSRNTNASNALKLLEFSGVNFKIEGRKIIIK